MSWLSKATGIHISPKKAYVNKKELGGFLKKAAPVAGVLTGGLGGALLGGAGAALGSAVKGEGLGGALKSGALGSLSGLSPGIGGLKGAFTGGIRGVGRSLVGGGAKNLVTGGAGDYGVGNFASNIAQQAGGNAVKNAFSGGLLGKLGGFVKENPEVVAAGLGMIADRGKNQAQADLDRAQAEKARAEIATQLREEEEWQRRQKALDPMRQAMVGRMNVSSRVAANPYLA